MAFTGTPTFAVISEKCVRITGLSIANGATGTITLDAATTPGNVVLPEQFQPKNYTGPAGDLISVNESIEISFNYVAAPAATTNLISVVKTGTDPSVFSAALANAGAGASPALEIFVRYQ